MQNSHITQNQNIQTKPIQTKSINKTQQNSNVKQNITTLN